MAIPSLTGVTTAWLLGNLGDESKALVKDAAGGIWMGFNWQRATQRYCENLYEQYKEIQIFGQPEPVPLESIFTHITILDKPSTFARYDIEALREAIREDPSQFREAEERLARSSTERIDGWELVRQPGNKRLFILGKPGVGKTTFLKYLTLQAIQGKLDAIPTFVSLKEWADSGLELLPFLSSRFDICDLPEAEPFVKFILSEGKALVLFDGLDEVGDEARERMRLIPTLTEFCAKYRKSQCLLTCRTASTDYTFEGFKYVEVAGFSEGQMHTFVHKWFKGDADAGFWEEFNKDENRSLHELGRIPLLLTLLCQVYQETSSFPRRRVEVYEEALDTLLKKWDSSRQIARDVAYHKLSLGRKRQMLARIAAETFDPGEYFFRQADLEKRIVGYLQRLPPADQGEDIDGSAVLKAIEAQHGILVERADHVYTFAHLTFQEYFTAKYIVDNARKRAIPRLLVHYADERWREVILLTVSLLDDADDFFVAFRRIIDSLIANDEKLLAFVHWAADKAASVQGDYKPAAVRSFYCYLAFDLALNLALAGAFDLDRALALNLARTRTRALARALAGDLDLDRALALALDLDLDRVLDCALDRTLNRARALAGALDRTRARDLARTLARALAHALAGDLARARALARARDLARSRDPNLHQALTVLQVPDENASAKDWRVFAHRLQSIVIARRDIGREWNFTQDQFERLNTYFQANQLLVECLNLAYVTDRVAIEDSLLLPPEI